jgi:hypothetical protein
LLSISRIPEGWQRTGDFPVTTPGRDCDGDTIALATCTKAYRLRMGESGSQQHREPGDHDDSEIIQFGGLPVRWPFPEIRLPPAARLKPNRTSVAIALAMLAVGLLIGFFGGRLTARHAQHKATSTLPVSAPVVVPLGSAIAMIGPRCATRTGNNLQLGLEIMNETERPVTVGAITAKFPLGGLRAISAGIGTCGQLPMSQLLPATSLSPGETEWIHITVAAVRPGCVGSLPVWFKVGYASAGQTDSVTLAGFPDLGPASFGQCRTNRQNAS